MKTDKVLQAIKALLANNTRENAEKLAKAAGLVLKPDSKTRSTWDRNFPDAVVMYKGNDVQKHDDYVAAKAGDIDAALRLLADTVKDEDLAKIAKITYKKERVIVVAVHAEELAGRNKIPIAYAALLEQRLGFELDMDIVQTQKVNRGGSSGVERLIKTVPFQGHVEKGRHYFLVDDTLTQGGTLASLKGYIETNGGIVIGVSALMGKQYSAKLSPSPETIALLRQVTGAEFERWWQNEFGYNFEKFTESEARYLNTLIRKSDVDTVRGQIIAARQT